MPRTIQLRTSTSKRITRPIQKLAIPEWEITKDEEDDQPTSHCLKVTEIAFPELDNKDIQHLCRAPGMSRFINVL